MGYVWCDGYVWDMCGVRYVWDMCGVRYANNLLKNPATKRLSGKKGVGFDRAGRAGCAGCAALGWAWGWASAVTVFSSKNAINKQTTAREICQVWFRAGIKFVLLQVQTQQGDKYCNCCT